MQTGLRELYCHVPDLADQENPIEDLLEKMARRVFRIKGLPETIDKEVTAYYANEIWQAVTEGYGQDLFTIDWDTPDYEMLRQLQVNVYHFSAAKNYQQLVDLSRALINEEGKLRTWTEFRNAAFEINNQHVIQWLRAEREQAIAAGQMASRWVGIEENKEILPLLQFDAVLDERTTPVCHDLDGVTRPVDDNFWDIYYPPNHWGCRSTVRQLNTGQVTPMEKVITPERMPAMFKTNLAKNGLAFPKDHPYYTGMPHNVTEQADKLLRNG